MPIATRADLTARINDALTRSSHWLAEGNEAHERGNKVKAEKLYAKSQYWLDRYNKLAGNS